MIILQFIHLPADGYFVLFCVCYSKTARYLDTVNMFH